MAGTMNLGKILGEHTPNSAGRSRYWLDYIRFFEKYCLRQNPSHISETRSCIGDKKKIGAATVETVTAPRLALVKRYYDAK